MKTQRLGFLSFLTTLVVLGVSGLVSAHLAWASGGATPESPERLVDVSDEELIKALVGSSAYEECKERIRTTAGSSCSSYIAPGSTLIITRDRAFIEVHVPNLRRWQESRGWNQLNFTDGDGIRRIPYSVP